MQSVTVLSSRVSHECRSPGLRSPPLKNARFEPTPKKFTGKLTAFLSNYTFSQRTPWRGWKKRGVENLTNDSPPKKGFWTPLVRYVFHPPHVSVLCFSCTEIHDRADQKLFWRGPKIFGRARSLVRFPPHIRFAPPHITAQFSDQNVFYAALLLMGRHNCHVIHCESRHYT